MTGGSGAARGRDMAVLAAGALLLFSVGLGARDLWNPNEPLYGQAVVEMVRSGDWLRPTVNGERFDEKPPLYYWLAALAARTGAGVDEFTLRLPSALAGVLGTLLLYGLVARDAGPGRARLAAATFATTFAVFWSARSMQMDLLVTVTTLGAVAAAYRATRAATGWVVPALAAGAWAGVGVLAKGPVGVVGPALVVLIDHVLARRPLAAAVRVAAVALPVAVAIVAPWLVALVAGGEGPALQEMFWRQNVTRFLTPFDHQAAWWYYVPYFLIDMAPWSLLVPLAWGLPRREPGARDLDRLAWIWIAALTVFFSLSGSKRSAYLLPIAPAVAILAAAVVEARVRGTLGPLRARVLGATFGGIAALLAGAGVFAALRAGAYPPLAAPGRALAATLLIAAAGLAAALVLGRRRAGAAPAALLGGLVAFYLLAGAWALPAANVYKSARAFSDAVVARVPADRPLCSYLAWRWRMSYVYYTRRSIPRIVTPEELRAYWARPEAVFLLVERGRLAEARAVLGPLEPLVAGEIGESAAYLFTNR